MSGDASAEPDPLQVRLGAGCSVRFTTRTDGNLSLAAGIDHRRGAHCRERLCEAMSLRWLCAGPQVHGTHISVIDEQTASLGEPSEIEADGRCTALRGVGAMVLSADCLPVALGADGVVAMVHAGWRGLASGVLEHGITAIRGMGVRSEVSAVIGPHAGYCCYEVGEEVHSAFGGRHRDGRLIDLGAIAEERLLQAGVSRVQRVGPCTICDERFFSYRREGELAGRQGGIAWLS